LSGEVSIPEAERDRAIRAGTLRAVNEYQRRRRRRKKQPTLKDIEKKHFLQLLQRDKMEEERNRVGWRTTLGYGPTSEETRLAILKQRLSMTSLQDPETACDRDPSAWRPVVEVGQYNSWLEEPTTFDFYQLKVAAQRRDWRRQEAAIHRFRAAVAKVVQRRRAERLLQRLAKLASSMNQPEEAEMTRQEEDHLLDELIGRPTRELPSWGLETSVYETKLFPITSKPSWETDEGELEVCLRELNSTVSRVISDRAPSIVGDQKRKQYPLLEEPFWLAESFTPFDVLEGRELAMWPLPEAALHRRLSEWMQENRPDAPNRTCVQLKSAPRTDDREEVDFPKEQLIPVDPKFTKIGDPLSMPAYLTEPVPEALTGGIPLIALYPVDYINTHLTTTNAVFDEVDMIDNQPSGDSSSDWDQPMYALATEPLEIDFSSLALLSNPDLTIDESEALRTYAAAAKTKAEALELSSAEIDEDALYQQVTQECVGQLSNFFENCPSIRQLLSDEMLENIDSVLDTKKKRLKDTNGHM
uniref:CFAP91 domain-containing protein n=1 Tax=Schistocephalus solidus TaxID=70667 RepID=A0A183SR69_SCHSO